MMFSSTIDPKVLPLVWQLSVVLLASVPAGWASVAQCEAGWEWSYNSKNQNPCEVAGYLQGSCLGYGTIYELGPLHSDYWYADPEKGDTEGLSCGCNTVIYSLYSACTACQNVSTETWSQWSHYCHGVYVTQYPFDVPGTTAVPRWAFIDITKEDYFNVTAAMIVGQDPEAPGKVPVILSLTPPHPSPSSSSTSAHKSTPTSSSSSGAFDPLSTNSSGDLGGNASQNKSNFPMIGGVIGGVVGFAILSSLVWFALRHRSSKEHPYGAHRRLSTNTYSTQSFYLPSTSPEPETTETSQSSTQTLGLYSPFGDPAPRTTTYGRHDSPSIISTESDTYTTDSVPLYRDGRQDNEATAF